MNILGVGTHIAECLRIAHMIERHGERFLLRAFTQREIEFCRERTAATQQYTAKWAAKEAVLKAIGATWSGRLNWRDIEIRQESQSRIHVAFAGEARDVCERLRIGKVLVSLSFCRTHATAYAIAVSDEYVPEELNAGLDLDEK